MADFDETSRRRRADAFEAADPAGRQAGPHDGAGERALSTTERLERLRDGLQKGLRRPGETRETASRPGSVRSSRAVDIESLRGRPLDEPTARPVRPSRAGVGYSAADPRPDFVDEPAPYDEDQPPRRAPRERRDDLAGELSAPDFHRAERRPSPRPGAYSEAEPSRRRRDADPLAEAPADDAFPLSAPGQDAGSDADDEPSLVRSMLSTMSAPEPARPATAFDAPQVDPGRGPGAEPARAPQPAPASAPPPAARRGFDDEEPRPVIRPPAGEKLRGAGPFSGVERLLSGRYLRARRKEGFISVIAFLSLIGIALGVATLIIVMSVMNGFRAELVGKIVGVNGHFTVRTVAEPFRDFDAVAQKVRAVPGVTRAAPLIEGQAFASTPRAGLGVVVRGLRRSDLLTLENVAVAPEFSLGSLTNFEGSNGVAVGQGLALRLGVTVGDTVTLISPRGSVTPFGVVPKRRSYKVLYIFKVGMANYDAAVMFMPLDEAQTFFNRAETVDAIELMVATPEDLSGYREEIAAAAGRSIDLDDWQRANQSLMGALKTERTVMFLILSLLIVIASLIIISGLIMLVKEKGPDIAILRTMGMSRGGVLRVFFMCGATIGVVGTTIGVGLGVAFCLNIEAIQSMVEYLANGEVFPDDVYILSKLPAKLHMEDVGFAVGISLGLSFLATLYPAWRAARLDPVEALRYE